MRNRLALVLCILCGSFFVYCTQSMVTGVGRGRHDGGTAGGGDSGGPVGDAMAQSSGGGTCCSPAPRESPTVLFDDVVKPTPISQGSTSCTMFTPTFDVSGYRTIIIHAPTCNFVAQFRNGKAGFVVGGTGTCNAGALPTALSVNGITGHDLRVNLGGVSGSDPDGAVTCNSTPPMAVTVVAYKDL